MKQRYYRRTVELLQSTRAFYAVMVLFVVQSAWLALSSVYPMAYDEGTHLGIIQLYTRHLSPFWSAAPDGAAPFGAISRDPSYLYHYLLSFPFRLFSSVFHSETLQVLFLRFISIALFGAGLIVYRRLLLKTGASKALVHTVLLLFVLTPVVPLLSSQINYDNLIFLLTGVVLLLTFKLVERSKRERPVDAGSMLLWLSICLLSCLVKYAFLPVFAACGIWLGYNLFKLWRRRGTTAITRQAGSSFTKISISKRTGLIVLVVLSIGLCIERYGVNVVRYHTPIPECDQVLNIERCMDYGPWRRNYLTFQDKVAGRLIPKRTGVVEYTFRTWGHQFYYQAFYALNGPASGYKVGESLTVARRFSLGVGALGLVLVAWQWRRIRRRFTIGALAGISVFYVAILWLQEYSDFRHIGIPVAIQARYLIPVLPVLYLVLALSYAQALRAKPYLKASLAWLALAIMLFEGGGIAAFIVRSDSTWYWPSQVVERINEVARRIFSWFVIGV